MADVTINQLPLKSGTAAGTDEMEIDDGASKKTTLAQLPISTAAQSALNAKADLVDPRFTDSRAPTGAAGGVLSGTFPNPGFAVDMATQAELDAGLATKPIVQNLNGSLVAGDLTGDARGDLAVDIQSGRVSTIQVASGEGALALGAGCAAIGVSSIAIGSISEAQSAYGLSIGSEAVATSDYGIAIGAQANSEGEYSLAIGFGCNSLANNSTAIGRSVSANAAQSGAFGYAVSTGIANVQEIGYWSNTTTRSGAVRVHGTGMVGMTIQDRSTAYADGGATAGAEADNTLLRGGYAIRRNGDVILIDINVAGIVKTLSLGTAT